MNQKGISSIVIILIIVGVLAIGGGIWYWQNQQSKPEACTKETKICPDGTSVGRTSPNCEFASCPEVKDETADWQTYRNEKYGFEVKYPPYLIAGHPLDTKFEPDEVEFSGYLSRLSMEFYNQQLNRNDIIIIVEAINLVSNEEANSFLQEMIQSAEKREEKYEEVETNSQLKGFKLHNFALFKKEDTIYSLGLFPKGERTEEENESTFDLVVKSFRLLK